MTKEEAIELFGGVSKLAKSIGIQPQSVSQWPEGEIYEPRGSQVELIALKRGLISWRAFKAKSKHNCRPPVAAGGRNTLADRKHPC